MTEIETYRVRDSLNAATVGSLTLTLAEFKRFRAEDAALIGALLLDKKNMQSVISVQTQTIRELRKLPLRDSVIYIDGRVADTVRCMEYHDQWLDFVGCQAADGTGSAQIRTRESLLVISHVRYKRFLGFLWRTRKIDSQSTDATSRNQHTQIVDLEHVIIAR